MLELFKLSLDKIFARTTTKKGFKNSMGWKRKNNRSNHRLEPFTSTPKNKTNANEIKVIIKIGIKIFLKKFNWIDEIKIIKKIADIAKVRCLEKKK